MTILFGSPVVFDNSVMVVVAVALTVVGDAALMVVVGSPVTIDASMTVVVG